MHPPIAHLLLLLLFISFVASALFSELAVVVSGFVGIHHIVIDLNNTEMYSSVLRSQGLVSVALRFAGSASLGIWRYKGALSKGHTHQYSISNDIKGLRENQPE